MSPLIKTNLRPVTLVALTALLAGCEAGPGSVHSVGVSQGCADVSPYLSGANGLPVRCGPQYQPITGG